MNAYGIFGNLQPILKTSEDDYDALLEHFRHLYGTRCNLEFHDLYISTYPVFAVRVFLDGEVKVTVMSTDRFAAGCETLCKGLPGVFQRLIELTIDGWREWRPTDLGYAPNPAPGLEKMILQVYESHPEDMPMLFQRLEPAAQAKVRTTRLLFHRKGLPLSRDERMRLLAMAMNDAMDDQEWDKILMEMWHALGL